MEDMYAEKFELLEAKIRETVTLVSHLLEEKQSLEQENQVLRDRIEQLEAEAREQRTSAARYEPNLDQLLAQLETLQSGVATPQADPEAEALQALLDKETKGAKDHFELGH